MPRAIPALRRRRLSAKRSRCAGMGAACQSGDTGVGGVGAKSNQEPSRASGDPVGHYVMEPDQHGCVTVGEPRQDPQLPQGSRPGERRLVELLYRPYQGGLVTRRTNGRARMCRLMSNRGSSTQP